MSSFVKLIARLPVEVDDMYYAVTRPFRRAAGAVLGFSRSVLFPKSLERCQGCGGVAQWDYMPSGTLEHWCDNCVPRGCNCNDIYDGAYDRKFVEGPKSEEARLIIEDIENEERAQHRDQKGRLLPCSEYWFQRWGWSKGVQGQPYKPSLAERFLDRYREEKALLRPAWQDGLDWKELLAKAPRTSTECED